MADPHHLCHQVDEGLAGHGRICEELFKPAQVLLDSSAVMPAFHQAVLTAVFIGHGFGFIRRGIGRNPAFGRIFGQQEVAEGIDCPEEAEVNVLQGLGTTLSGQIGGGRQFCRAFRIAFRRFAHALAQPFLEALVKFVGSRLGERDGTDLVHGYAAFDHGNHAFDKDGCLARSGPGFNEEVCIDFPDDAVTLVLIRQYVRTHQLSSLPRPHRRAKWQKRQGPFSGRAFSSRLKLLFFSASLSSSSMLFMTAMFSGV